MTTLCKHCVSGYVLPGDPKGSFQDGAYVYSPHDPRAENSTDQPTNKGSRAIVLLTDSFGLALKNPRILADSFGERLQCEVLVPDLFNGHPPINDRDLGPYVPDVPGQKIANSVLGWIKYGLIMLRSLPSIIANRPAVGVARAQTFIESIQNRYERIGLVGYCYGGAVCLALASRKDLLHAVVACHPGPVDLGDIPRATVPLAMLVAEDDQWLRPAKRDLAEAALKGNTAIQSKLVLHSGTVHGFAVRPNLGIPQVKEAFETAFEESVDWFSAHL